MGGRCTADTRDVELDCCRCVIGRDGGPVTAAAAEDARFIDGRPDVPMVGAPIAALLLLLPTLLLDVEYSDFRRDKSPRLCPVGDCIGGGATDAATDAAGGTAAVPVVTSSKIISSSSDESDPSKSNDSILSVMVLYPEIL